MKKRCIVSKERERISSRRRVRLPALAQGFRGRRAIVRGLSVACGFLALASGAHAFHDDASSALQVQANLTGGQQVPEVLTAGGGVLSVVFNDTLTAADFTLNLTGANPVIGAHLQCARAGLNGPVVATLFGPVPDGVVVDGTLASGTLVNSSMTAPDITDPAFTDPLGNPVCPSPVNNVAALFSAIRDGFIFVNVRSTVNSDGELRGQLFSAGCPQEVAPPAPTEPSPDEPPTPFM